MPREQSQQQMVHTPAAAVLVVQLGRQRCPSIWPEHASDRPTRLADGLGPESTLPCSRKAAPRGSRLARHASRASEWFPRSRAWRRGIRLHDQVYNAVAPARPKHVSSRIATPGADERCSKRDEAYALLTWLHATPHSESTQQLGDPVSQSQRGSLIQHLPPKRMRRRTCGGAPQAAVGDRLILVD
jgi:hypothetical protein